MRALAAALFLLPTAPAIAGGPDLSHLGEPAFAPLRWGRATLAEYELGGTIFSYYEPPAFWFDIPLKKKPKYHRLAQIEIIDICSEAVGFMEMTACNISVDATGDCDIYMRDDLPADADKRIARHEFAHCAGWPANHP